MIIKNENNIQYGIKYLLFTTLQEFKSLNYEVAPGSRAYVVETGKTYILDDTNSWTVFNTGASIGMFVLKGTVASAQELQTISNYKSGNAYKVTDGFYVEGLGYLESGEILLAINDGTAYDVTDWIVLQNDLDVFIGATASANGSQGVVPQPLAGQQGNYLSANGTWKAVALDELDQGFEQIIFDGN